jgi:hypothetical protein
MSRILLAPGELSDKRGFKGAYLIEDTRRVQREQFRNAKGIIMKRSTIAKIFTIAAALALGIAPTAKAQVNKGCSNATMTGTFAYTVTGSFVAAPAPLGPYAEAGAQTFDGNGGTTAAGMSNTNGSVAPSSGTGAYTVNSDCTGTFTIDIAPGITAHYFFVISDSGAEYQAVCLDPVAVITRSGRRLYPGRNI